VAVGSATPRSATPLPLPSMNLTRHRETERMTGKIHSNENARIASGEAWVIRLPLRRPHFWAGHITPGDGYVVLRLRLDNGIEGWGETQVLRTWGGDFGRQYGETPNATLVLFRDVLFPAISGCNVAQIETLHARMDKALRGYPYAKAAVDVAAHDALGKLLNVPVYQLLGGKCRDRIELAHSIGLMDIQPAVDEASAVVAEGIKTLKLKIGVDADRDIKLVGEIRSAIGPKPRIRVDANQGYKSWREAVRVILAMEKYDIWYAEQPVEGLRGMAEVSKRINVPVMADESLWTAEDVVEILRMGAAEMLSVYYTKPGGLAKAKRLLAVAGAGGLQCDINGSGEMAIGNAANLHLAASSPEIVLPGTIPVTSTAEHSVTEVAGHKYLDDIIKTPFVYEDGYLLPPVGPGLGIEVDEKKIEKYRVA
jgi:L-alanine-DL-glutamate epimerase-like enolase superfamily enzyme